MNKTNLERNSLMKTLAASVMVMFSTLTVQAKTVRSSELQISPSEVDKVIRLVEKKQGNSSSMKLSIIVTDNGMSTDIAPRYTVYLGFAALAEMGNISANFKINDQVMDFVSASRKSAGIYEVKVIEYREDKIDEEPGRYEVTMEIDATKLFSDERNLRNNCDDFCDKPLQTTLTVKETVKRMN